MAAAYMNQPHRIDLPNRSFLPSHSRILPQQSRCEGGLLGPVSWDTTDLVRCRCLLGLRYDHPQRNIILRGRDGDPRVQCLTTCMWNILAQQVPRLLTTHSRNGAAPCFCDHAFRNLIGFGQYVASRSLRESETLDPISPPHLVSTTSSLCVV